VTVQPGVGGVEQDRAFSTFTDGSVDDSADRSWQWNEDGFVALAVGLQDAVAVLLADVADVGTVGLEDS
jgi:hypothetical protein